MVARLREKRRKRPADQNGSPSISMPETRPGIIAIGMHVPAVNLHRGRNPPPLAQPAGQQTMLCPAARAEDFLPHAKPLAIVNGHKKFWFLARIDRKSWLAPPRRIRSKACCEGTCRSFHFDGWRRHRGGCGKRIRAVAPDSPNARQKHQRHVRECGPPLPGSERTYRDPRTGAEPFCTRPRLVAILRVDLSAESNVVPWHASLRMIRYQHAANKEIPCGSRLVLAARWQGTMAPHGRRLDAAKSERTTATRSPSEAMEESASEVHPRHRRLQLAGHAANGAGGITVGF